MKPLLGLLMFSAALAYGQGPDFFPWWERPIAQNLNLTADQQKQIHVVVREFRDRLIQQRAAVQIAEGNLKDLMDEDPVSEPKTREAIDKVVAARAELMRTFSLMALRLRLVLTPQQWQTVQSRVGPRARQRLQQLRGRGPAPGRVVPPPPGQPVPPAAPAPPAPPAQPAPPRF